MWDVINAAFPVEQLERRFTGIDWSQHINDVHDKQHPKRAIPRIVRFQASATEQEIWCGALSVPNAGRHVLAIIREIDQPPNMGDAGQFRDFFDVKSGEIDPVPQAALRDLKKEIEDRLGDNAVILKSNVRLGIGVDESGRPAATVSTAHIDELCREVESRLAAIIERQIKQYWHEPQVWDNTDGEPSIDDRSARELEIERDEHLRFGNERGPKETFVGRMDQLERIRAYVEDDSQSPFVIHGDSGCGKTALLARAFQEIPAEKQPIIRFIGVTPRSSDLGSLLKSLCQELRGRNAIADEIPSDVGELVQEFWKHLEAATAKQPVILLLDALDQLSDADNGRQLSWIPFGQLPSHVKIVVSCLSDRAEDDPIGQPFVALQRRRLPTENMLNLNALSLNEAKTLLFDRWFRAAGRTINSLQRRLIELKLEPEPNVRCRQPLYLKLLFEEAKLWRSYDAPPEPGDSVPELLNQLCHRLSRPEHHGESLVRFVLGYIAVARRGLSETEILEVLFADPNYKNELDEASVRYNHTLPTEPPRIPIAIWARLRADLAPYLTEQSAHGGNVLTVYHQQVAEWVEASFVNKADWDSHGRLAAYFERLWRKPSARAMDEIPYQLAKASDTDGLDRILCDLSFLEAKSTAGMVDDLLADYERAQLAFAARWDEERPIADFARFVSHEAHFLRAVPGAFYQQAFNSGKGSVSRAAASLRRERDFSACPWLCKTAGTTRQLHSGAVISMAFWGHDRYLAVSTTEQEVWVWDLARDSLWRRCETPPSTAKSLAVSPDGKFLAAGFGAAEPTPFASGAIVWNRDGRIVRQYALENWVYHVRWRDNTQLVLAAGLPQGSEAAGTLWQASLFAPTCEAIERHLADRPLVLTWDPVSGCSDQIMMLAMDGVVCHLTPEYVPTTQAEISEMFSEALASGEKGEALNARMRAVEDRIAAQRPVVARVCSPCTGTFGFYRAAQTAGPNKVCILGEPPVPEYFFAWHVSKPNGIYVYDFDQGSAGQLRFNDDALRSGFRAICIGVAPEGDLVTVGTAHGEALTFSLRTDGGPVERIHHANYPVTAVCYSDSGKSVAVGGGSGEIAVYDRAGKGLLFETQRADAPVTAHVAGSAVLILQRDHLVFVPLNASAEAGVVHLPEGHVGIDFDLKDNLVVVLSGRRFETSETLEYSVHLIDVAERRLVLNAVIPDHVPAPEGSFAAERAPDFLRRVRLRVADDRVCLLVGSARGLMEYPLLAFAGGRPFILRFDRDAARQRSITVTRGFDTPEVSCEAAAVSLGGAAVFCGYADNQDHPRVSGELRVWDGHTAEPSEVQRFSGSIRALGTTSDGIVIVGTDDCEASSLQFDESWQPLATVHHSVAVVAVAYAEERGLACSASRDGVVKVWACNNGALLLQTFVDVEPVFVGFTTGANGLCMVDRCGELHVWKIEGLSDESQQRTSMAETGRSRGLIQRCLAGAAHLGRFQDLIAKGDRDGAMLLLDALPDVPDAPEVRRYWMDKLAGGPIPSSSGSLDCSPGTNGDRLPGDAPARRPRCLGQPDTAVAVAIPKNNRSIAEAERSFESSN